MEFYVAIYSSPWKTYLPGQPLHHTVHVYTIQSKHLLKETHSPTYTVNFCKYYKGKLSLLLTIFQEVSVDWFVAFGYIFYEKNHITGWLTVTCVDNSFI